MIDKGMRWSRLDYAVLMCLVLGKLKVNEFNHKTTCDIYLRSGKPAYRKAVGR